MDKQPEEDIGEDSEKIPPMPDANNPAMLVMFYDRWFVRCAIAAGLGVLALALFVVKLWNPMPASYKGSMRISGLDYLQASALQRTAIKAVRAGNLPSAMIAWRSAIANNGGDLDLYRGMLRTLVEFPKSRREYLGFAVTEGMSLLEISGTNVNDVELLSSYLRRFELYDWIAEMMKSRGDSLTAKGARLYAECLFFTGKQDQFAQYWNSRESDLSIDPASVLVHTAWQAYWGPPAGIAEARRKLAEARLDPRLGIFASKLQLRVCERIPDLQTFKSALSQLQEAHEEQVFDSIAYWKLLQDSGNTADAVKLAKAFATAPATPEEAMQLAGVFELLGMNEYCDEFLAKYTPEFPQIVPLWTARSQMIIKLKRWDELREIAIAMRNTMVLARFVGGYSYYLEGLAEARVGKKDAAGVRFKKSIDEPFPTPLTAFIAASELQAIGFPDLAASLLKKNEADFEDRIEFWLQLTMSAFESKDTDLLMRASQRAYDIDPRNLSAINNYAASLLVSRTKAEEAVKLTMKLVASDPDRRDFKINHALALAMNHRYNDAEQVLLRMDQSSLNSVESSLIHYAWFQMFADRDLINQAAKEAAGIERQILIGSQAKYVADTLKRLGID